jgi:hypothetical protein
MSEFDDFLQMQEVKKALDKALRQLEKQRIQQDDLWNAVFSGAYEASLTLELGKLPRPVQDKRKKDEEVAACLLSDWQLSKVTPTYSTEVCELRIQKYAEKVKLLTNIQRADHPVKTCRVWLVGDIIEGELIFPGQSHLIDASLFRQVCVDGPRILGNLLIDLSTQFDTVYVSTVIGNHGSLGGRARRDYHPESNADAMLYEVTRMLTEPVKGIVWTGPNWYDNERKWYYVDKVFDHGVLMFHGDQVKGGFGGYPWYGFGKKLQGWATGAIKEPFKYAVGGHFHTPVRMYLNGLTYWGNGSTESDNTYAAEQLAAAGEPTQWLLYFADGGVSAEYLVRL